MSFLPLIILIGLIVYNNTSTIDSNLEKTIAVLPFINDSSNEENMYFCNGIMAGIRDHLAKIPEFAVVSRRSVELYRDSLIPLKTIAKDLDVNYVVEGHVQRIGDRAIISAELIQVSDSKVIWSERYDKDVSEIFTVQANVIQSITSNLETTISPNLKIQLEELPTQDKTAYDHYLKGEEYRFKARYDIQKNEVWLNLLNKAQLSYELAIERDSLFAQAYVGVARNIRERNGKYMVNGKYMLEENNLEKVLINLNKAIQINPHLTEAYKLRGLYYSNTNEKDKAKKDLEKALDLDPNNNETLGTLSYIYKVEGRFIEDLKVFDKMNKRPETTADTLRVYTNYRYYYAFLDDYKSEQYYLDKIAKISPGFSNTQVWLYNRTQQWEKAIEHIKKHWQEQNQQTNIWLANHYSAIPKKNKEALKYYGDWHKQVVAEGISCWSSSRSYHRYGHALIRDGQVEKGIKMVKKQIEVFEKLISLDRADQWVYYDLAGAYTLLGQLDMAYQNMDKFEELKGWIMWGGMVEFVKHDTQFNTLRQDSRFHEWVKGGEKQLTKLQKQIRPYLPSASPSLKD